MQMRNVLALWCMLLYSAAPSGIRPSTIVAHLMLNGHEQNQAAFEWQLEAGSTQLLSQARTALQSPVIRIFVGHGNEVHDAAMHTHRCRATPDACRWLSEMPAPMSCSERSRPPNGQSTCTSRLVRYACWMHGA